MHLLGCICDASSRHGSKTKLLRKRSSSSGSRRSKHSQHRPEHLSASNTPLMQPKFLNVNSNLNDDSSSSLDRLDDISKDKQRSNIEQHPTLFYAIRDGVVFKPGLPPSLSVESLRKRSNSTTSAKRRLEQLFGTPTRNRKKKTDQASGRKHRHRHRRRHLHKGRLPPAPSSSPTVLSRHFAFDADIYPPSSRHNTNQDLVDAQAALLNLSSFRVIIERIKRWFLQKSRRILTPRNIFRRAHSSSRSSLTGSLSTLSAASSSSTSLCDSNPSLTDIGIGIPPIGSKSTTSANGGLTIVVGKHNRGSNSSLSSSESVSSLLEFKKRVGRQRKAMEREQLQNSFSQQAERHRQYLEEHGKTAHTVTSTISCPTGRHAVGRRGGRSRHRDHANADASTMLTSDTDHCSLQLSASWPLIDRLSVKLTNQPDVTSGEFYDGDFFNEKIDETLGAMSTMAERKAGWRQYMAQQTQDSARDSVSSDCAIPFQDLRFTECIRDSDGHKIFSGQWYGSVMIHLFSGFSDRDVGAFWSQVHKMVTLRHDNVALFMGAAVERALMAIVISVQSTVSLYDQIHVNGNSMGANIITIGRQLTQGMGYLHSRNIVLGHLNSRNVFIDGKLKISMADCSKPRRDNVKHGYTCLARGAVTYLAPELLKSLYLVQEQHINIPPKLCFQQTPTTDTDVYAFGTLMYEVAYSEFPFSSTQLEAVIYQICTGQQPTFYTESSSPTEVFSNSSLLASIRVSLFFHFIMVSFSLIFLSLLLFS